MVYTEIKNYAFIRFKLGISPLDVLKEIKSVFNDKSPGKTTLYAWYRRFEKNNEPIKRSIGSGRKRTALTLKNIELVDEMIK